MCTISNRKPPQFYLKLVKEHFIRNSDTITLQCLNTSSPDLVCIASLIVMKGYGVYKKIKNDVVTVPERISNSDLKLSNVKKVRLIVKIKKSPDFDSIIKNENDPPSFLEYFKQALRSDQKVYSEVEEEAELVREPLKERGPYDPANFKNINLFEQFEEKPKDDAEKD